MTSYLTSFLRERDLKSRRWRHPDGEEYQFKTQYLTNQLAHEGQ